MKKVISGLAVLLIVLGIVYFFPWGNIAWGKVTLSSERTVTVSGYAESNIANQIGKFSAGVNTLGDNKESVVSEVNTKMEAIVKAVKEFGISDDDIQTSQINVYQMQEAVNPTTTGRVKLGQWSANYTLEITLRDVSKAGELTALLNNSGATNVYGPNFQLDLSNRPEDALLGEAVANAREKAASIAAVSGARLGRVISVVEGGQVAMPLMYKRDVMMSVEAAAPVEAGSTNVSKTVTVVWGLE